MNSKLLPNVFRINLLTILGLVTVTPLAFAEEYWLQAKPTSKTMPGTNEVVTMWGYATCTSLFATCATEASVPGPALTVSPGQGLTIHLKNELPEKTSIVIPGQTATMAPVKIADGQGRQRVRSFTQEASTNGGTADYSWPSISPGTYLYHSGTHPQVQVQMGLYGGMKQDAVAATASTPAQAYPGVAYDAEVTLLYSEIDPALHAAVAGSSYGTAAYPSTINYAPKYFLVNGKPFEATDPPLAAASAGKRTLIRFLNAGLQTHVPVLQGLDMQLVAEDGNLYPYVKNQYSAFLPAAKTVDAILSPDSAQAGTYVVFDRKLALSNGALPGGGLLAKLTVGAAGAGTPVATPDTAYATAEETLLTVAAPGVLANDTPATGLTSSLVSSASKGTVTLAADGSFSYLPQANFSGNDKFTYRAGNGSMNSNVATVTINVTPVNDQPVAANNSYVMLQGGSLTVAASGVLVNDTDPDVGDTLTAVNFGAASNGTVTGNANGGFTYTPLSTFTGNATFTYRAQDNSGAANNTSNPATVTIAVNANRAPIAVNDTATTRKRTLTNPNTIVIGVLGNDSDPDTAIDPSNMINPASIVIVNKPNKWGTVSVNANGTVNYTPNLNFTGTETFTYTVKDNLGKVSNKATVRVNVTR